jgi:hypothetical protein
VPVKGSLEKRAPSFISLKIGKQEGSLGLPLIAAYLLVSGEC